MTQNMNNKIIARQVNKKVIIMFLTKKIKITKFKNIIDIGVKYSEQISRIISI